MIPDDFADDLEQVGGKNASLGEMYSHLAQDGIRVADAAQHQAGDHDVDRGVRHRDRLHHLGYDAEWRLQRGARAGNAAHAHIRLDRRKQLRRLEWRV